MAVGGLLLLLVLVLPLRLLGGGHRLGLAGHGRSQRVRLDGAEGRGGLIGGARAGRGGRGPVEVKERIDSKKEEGRLPSAGQRITQLSRGW